MIGHRFPRRNCEIQLKGTVRTQRSFYKLCVSVFELFEFTVFPEFSKTFRDFLSENFFMAI
ncbi:hypothetical protein CH367_00635 [Leptospira barantonii]|uniref:Uncharacterized protein n=1 Tax=Leptospira barantonii TaxID=2023184 RepID=A0ABX4NP54_9LEPT|nr:hypothetical protein CH367_00635 [Leptospira barantonii]